MQRYYIALLIPPPLAITIHSWKEALSRQYGTRSALTSPAHITLVPPFGTDLKWQPELQQLLDRFAQTQTSFELQTTGFAAFPPRTLFVAVASSPELDGCKRALDAHIATEAISGIRPDARPFHPHITVANRDLTLEAFQQAWEEVQPVCLTEKVAITGISLLRHTQKKWEVVHTSHFQ